MKDADWGSAAGEDAAAVDGVHVDAVARGRRVSAIDSAGGSGEVEGEGVLVVVAHSAMMSATMRPSWVAVAWKVRLMARLRSTRCIHITGKADVVEVAERLPVLRCQPESGSARIGLGIRRRARSAFAATELHMAREVRRV